MRGVTWGASVAIVVLLAACYPVTELARPRVVKAGEARFAVGATYSSTAPWDSRPQPVPLPELGFRVGVADRVDVGGRVTLASAQADVGLQLVQGEGAGDFDMTLSPGIVAGQDGDSLFEEHDDRATRIRFVGARVPVTVGYRANENVEPWATASLHAGSLHHQYEDTSHYFSAGAAVGLDLKVMSWLTLQPQLALFVPLAGPARDLPEESVRLGTDDYRVAAALNFFFDTGDD